MGLIRAPGTALVAGGNRRSCTLVFLFRGDGPGGTVEPSEMRVGVLRSRFEKPRLWREPEVEQTRIRNDGDPSACDPVGLGRSQQDPR